MNPTRNGPGRTTWVLLAVLATLLLTWGIFYRPMSHALGVRLFLASQSPRDEVFEDLLKHSSTPLEFIRRCWNTGKIVHRQLVMNWFSKNATPRPTWCNEADDLLVTGAADKDESVRELALGTLDAIHSPRLFECARAQLGDLDPMVRLLGLEYLRKANPRQAVPIIIPLLDDSDLRVAAQAELALSRWSGQDFGVRMRLTIPVSEGPNAGQIDPSNAEAIRLGLNQRKEWWLRHETEYATTPAATPALSATLARFPAANFELKDLEGKTVRLADYRGQVLLLNFWATWCTACQAELSELVALQRKLGDQCAILGVALDGVPDEHGHRGGETEEGDSNQRSSSLVALREKLARTVKARGINYPVTWDASGVVSAAFNGGELPTTVIIDAEGCIRRRFVGERSLKVFEAMIEEARRDHAPTTPRR